MSVKTKEIRAILWPIEEQVNKLRGLVRSNGDDTEQASQTNSVLLQELQGLGMKFDELLKVDISDYQEMKSKITDIVDEFCSLEFEDTVIDDIGERALEDIASTALHKFTLALVALEKLECLPLKQRLIDCWEYVKAMGAANEIEHLQNIKELGTSILELIGPLQRYKKSLVSQVLSEKIILYSCQLCTALKLLVELVKEQHRLNAPIYNCKKYTCDRFCYCLKIIIEILDGPDPLSQDEMLERENHFVYRMDLALDIISEMPKKNQDEQVSECDELWLRIEDIFSHAMAIAQVCEPYNFKAITGACHSIISEYENLKLQLKSESCDAALNNLFMNTLNDALYRLERKVNISVLNLVMEVFSDPFSALRKLVMSCGNSLSAKKRSKSDLTDVIEDFDQIIDKIMQIGLFAIASCNDRNRVIQIQNSLAGLESLETELVSSITAFYLHPDSKEMRANVKLLTAQWQLDVNKLHDTIDLIIDSAAYCEVVLDDLQQRISSMMCCLENREPVTQLHVQSVVQRSLSLSRQVSATINDLGSDIIERQTIMMVRKLKAAIFEADAASKSLLTESAPEPQQLRVIKRCELILNVVKRLQPALVTIMNNTLAMNTNYGKPGKGQGDTIQGIKFSSTMYGSSREEKSLAYIRTPYTVGNCKSPLSIQPANSLPRAQSDLSSLIPYIKRGREMRTERSVMYKTPRKTGSENQSQSESKLKRRSLTNIRQHLFSRDGTVSHDDISLLEESIDLTGILEKFTSGSTTLGTTLSSLCQENTLNAKATNQPHKSSVKNLTESFVKAVETQRSGKVNESSTVGGGDGPSVLNTSKQLFRD